MATLSFVNPEAMCETICRAESTIFFVSLPPPSKSIETLAVGVSGLSTPPRFFARDDHARAGHAGPAADNAFDAAADFVAAAGVAVGGGFEQIELVVVGRVALRVCLGQLAVQGEVTHRLGDLLPFGGRHVNAAVTEFKRDALVGDGGLDAGDLVRGHRVVDDGFHFARGREPRPIEQRHHHDDQKRRREHFLAGGKAGELLLDLEQLLLECVHRVPSMAVRIVRLRQTEFPLTTSVWLTGTHYEVVVNFYKRKNLSRRNSSKTA